MRKQNKESNNMFEWKFILRRIEDYFAGEGHHFELTSKKRKEEETS